MAARVVNVRRAGQAAFGRRHYDTMPSRSHPGPVPMLAKLVVVAIFIGVLASLASALLYLVKDRGQSDRTVKALTMRVGISIGLLCLLVLLWALGLIQPHGIRP